DQQGPAALAEAAGRSGALEFRVVGRTEPVSVAGAGTHEGDAMKAYKVSCRDPDHGEVVVFAEKRSDAKQLGYRDSCDCDWIDLRVHRAPKFDQYAPGPVTVE